MVAFEVNICHASDTMDCSLDLLFFALLLLLHLFLDILIRKCHCVHLYDAPSQPMCCLDLLSFCENYLLMTAQSAGMQPRCCLICREPVGCQPALENCAQGWSLQNALSLNNIKLCFHFYCHYHWLQLWHYLLITKVLQKNVLLNNLFSQFSSPSFMWTSTALFKYFDTPEGDTIVITFKFYPHGHAHMHELIPRQKSSSCNQF